MGIGSDIAPRPKPKADKPKAEKKKEKPKLEPGEVEVGVKVDNKKNKDLYSDFLSDWDDSEDDDSKKHHHHNHGHIDAKDDQLENNDDIADEEKPKKPKRGGSRLIKWIVLFLIVLIIIIIWQNYSRIIGLFSSNADGETSEQSDDVAYYDNSEVDYANGDTSEDSASTETVESDATTTTIDKTSIALQVLNGSGVTGAAATANQVLVDAGFTVSSTTNAKKFTYESTIIYYKTGKDAEANLVAETLSGYVTSVENEDSIMGTYDVIVVIGKT